MSPMQGLVSPLQVSVLHSSVDAMLLCAQNSKNATESPPREPNNRPLPSGSSVMADVARASLPVQSATTSITSPVMEGGRDTVKVCRKPTRPTSNTINQCAPAPRKRINSHLLVISSAPFPSTSPLGCELFGMQAIRHRRTQPHTTFERRTIALPTHTNKRPSSPNQ